MLRRYGNINPSSIDYACRPRLRSRLTQGGLAWPWTRWMPSVVWTSRLRDQLGLADHLADAGCHNGDAQRVIHGTVYDEDMEGNIK